MPSARRKKCGSKSKYVSLPHDGMTERQWKKMNGEVITYNLSKPIPWETFKVMPADLAKTYVEQLQKEYNATIRDIAKCMKISDATLYRYFKASNPDIHFPKGKCSSEDDKGRLAKFYGQDNVAQKEVPVAEVEIQGMEERTVEPECVCVNGTNEQRESIKIMEMPSFTLNFAGPYDEQMVMQSLRLILGERVDCEMTISVRKRGT